MNLSSYIGGGGGGGGSSPKTKMGSPGSMIGGRKERTDSEYAPSVISSTGSGSGRSGRMFLNPPGESQLKMEKALQSSGETYHAAVPANKFTYDYKIGDWHITRTSVKIAHHHFAKGGMRMCYRAAEIIYNQEKKGEIETVIPSVVKLFMKKPKPYPSQNAQADKDHSKSEGNRVFHEALTQGVSQGYAEVFNRVLAAKGLPSSLHVSFLPVSVLHFPTLSNGTTYATIEPFLPGDYVKLNDNTGRKKSQGAELAQVFSYFTYIASGGSLVVCDIQGVGSTFTDPQIHSIDGKLFGAGNLGVIGINRFLNSLEPSELLDKLGLSLPQAIQQKYALGGSASSAAGGGGNNIPLPPFFTTPSNTDNNHEQINAKDVATNSAALLGSMNIPSSLINIKDDIANDEKIQEKLENSLSTLDYIEAAGMMSKVAQPSVLFPKSEFDDEDSILNDI